MTPASAARSGTRGRSPFGFGRCIGRSGSIAKVKLAGPPRWARVDDQDITKTLSELPTRGTDDCTTRVLEVHERVMEVNQADAVRYQGAIQAGNSVNGFSRSASP